MPGCAMSSKDLPTAQRVEDFDVLLPWNCATAAA